ncbi:hypothetical protein K3495_g9374 [Podosphaera aphanis]|nr:hypothetical protein K3495_g9374 [Podosphaera aphanis]
MKVQVSAWKDHANDWKDNVNFWKSKYRHQNCYPRILENATKGLRKNKEPPRTNNTDRGFTSISENVVTPGDVRDLRDAREAAKTRDREAIDGRKSARQDIKVAKQFMDNQATKSKAASSKDS